MLEKKKSKEKDALSKIKMLLIKCVEDSFAANELSALFSQVQINLFLPQLELNSHHTKLIARLPRIFSCL